MTDIKPGDLIFVKGKELHRARREWLHFCIAWLISWITKSEYTHVAIAGNGGFAIDADLGHRVMQIKVSEYRCYDVYRVPPTNGERQEAVSFCIKQLGKKYDLVAVLAIGVQRLTGWRIRRKEDPRRWFCSELAAAAWNLRRHPGRVSPGALAKDPRLVKVKTVGLDAA